MRCLSTENIDFFLTELDVYGARGHHQVLRWTEGLTAKLVREQEAGPERWWADGDAEEYVGELELARRWARNGAAKGAAKAGFTGGKQENKAA